MAAGSQPWRLPIIFCPSVVRFHNVRSPPPLFPLRLPSASCRSFPLCLYFHGQGYFLVHPACASFSNCQLWCLILLVLSQYAPSSLCILFIFVVFNCQALSKDKFLIRLIQLRHSRLSGVQIVSAVSNRTNWPAWALQ